MKLQLCIFFWFISHLVVLSQTKTAFSIQFKNETLPKVIKKLEHKYQVTFSYQDNLLNNKYFTLKKQQITLTKLLKLIAVYNKLKFKKISKNNYIIIGKKVTLNDIQELDNVVIYNYLTKGIQKNKNTSFELNLDKLSILPGLLEADIIESIQQLPGVISPNETATGLIVRGGSNDQNRVIWDNINSYHNGHLFGMISGFNPDMAKKVTFYNKGTNPKYGERISSVINIETDDNVAKKTHVGFGLNGLNASAYLAAPIIKNKLSFTMASRRSYTEFYKTNTFNKLAKKVYQSTKIIEDENGKNDFFFSDYSMKINFTPNKKNQFYFSTFNIKNELDYLISTPATDSDDRKLFNDFLGITNKGYSVKWNANWSKNIKQSTWASFSNYNLNYNYKQEENRSQASEFIKKNTIFDTTINTDVTLKMTKTDKLNVGYQYNFKDVSHSFKDKADVILELDSDKTLATTHAIFANYSFFNTNLFDFEGGFRINYFSELNKIKFEPRLVLHKEIFKHLKVQITGEVKNQIISQIDETVLSDLSLENKIWRLSNNQSHPIINSNQISAGLIYKNKGWSVDVDFYNKYTKGLAALSLGFLNPLDNTIHYGNQKIKGVDFYIKKDFKNFKTWFSYAFSDVKNKFNDINNNKYFKANNAITHASSISVAYKYKKFETALGLKVHSGKPYTKGVVNEDDKNEFNEINTEQLALYHRMDFSSTYHFVLNKKNKINSKIGFSIRNLYNKNNQISREYVGNNSIDDPIKRVDKFSLGFTPNFLLKVYW